MKKALSCFVSLIFSISLSAQIVTTFSGANRVQSDGYTGALYKVAVYNDRTEVTVELIPTRNKSRLNYYSSRNTYLICGNSLKIPIIGFLRDGKVDSQPFSGTWGWSNVKSGEHYYYTMVFAGRIPGGYTNFTLKDEGAYDGSRGYGFSNYTINNPDPCRHTGLTEYSIKQKCDTENDGIVGIYEGVNDNKYKIGVVKTGTSYELVYLSGGPSSTWWHVGDVKATLRSSSTPGLFKAIWYMFDKSTNDDCYVAFDGTSIRIIIDGEESMYLKMYPDWSSSGSSNQVGSSSTWSGSGFALKDGYLVTNHHVVDGAKFITVKGIKGDFSTAYSAEVAAIDKNNDLALIKIRDSRFSGFGNIPYSVKTTTSDVGEDVYVLGYPLTTTMGDEIKYTTGVISSKTGFQGDVSVYQISAPIQPGNSGGPLFDSKGNLIGIVNAKHTGAENVGYAIKTTYLRNLIESFTTTSIIPTTNSVASMSRTEQIKSIKKYVFLIECSRSGSTTSYSTYSGGTYSSGSGNSSVNKSINGDVKTVKYPSGGSNNNTTITKVELSKSYTKVYIHYVNNYASGGWCSISPDTYIQGPSGNPLKLVKANNIPLSPNKHSFSYTGETLDFCLEFPALTYCHDIRYFKLVEPGDSSWKFYEIIVN